LATAADLLRLAGGQSATVRPTVVIPPLVGGNKHTLVETFAYVGVYETGFDGTGLARGDRSVIIDDEKAVLWRTGL